MAVTIIGDTCQVRMARVLTYGSHAVYVLDERGQPHHRPHAHIKHGKVRVASVFLITLEVFDQVERLPPGLREHISEHHEELLAKWEELNGE